MPVMCYDLGQFLRNQMQFAFFEIVSDRARYSIGANLCLEWLQEKLCPNLAV